MPQFLRIKTKNDRIFREGTFPDMQSVVMTDAAVKPVQRKPFSVETHTVRTDTISAVLQHGKGKILALNFANAMFPGGGYILGGNAQKEALCRTSHFRRP